jgi:hypothetical protein
MSIGVPEALLIHTVTIVEPAAVTDAYQNTDYSYGPEATRTQVKAWMQQDARSIVTDDGGTPLEARWLLITNERDIGRRAHIEWAGIVFELDGQPAPTFAGLAAAQHHTELALRVIDG